MHYSVSPLVSFDGNSSPPPSPLGPLTSLAMGVLKEGKRKREKGREKGEGRCMCESGVERKTRERKKRKSMCVEKREGKKREVKIFFFCCLVV